MQKRVFHPPYKAPTLDLNASFVPSDKAFNPNGYEPRFDGAFPDENHIADSACDMNDDPVDIPELEAWGFHEVSGFEIALDGFLDRFQVPFDC